MPVGGTRIIREDGIQEGKNASRWLSGLLPARIMSVISTELQVWLEFRKCDGGKAGEGITCSHIGVSRSSSSCRPSWFTGLLGSGTSSVATSLERILYEWPTSATQDAV